MGFIFFMIARALFLVFRLLVLLAFRRPDPVPSKVSTPSSSFLLSLSPSLCLSRCLLRSIDFQVDAI